MMNTIIPKVTIYRIGKFDLHTPFIDLLLMIRNNNNSRALVGFDSLTYDQLDGIKDKVVVKVDLPMFDIIVDAQDIYQDGASVAASQADSAATTVRAAVATNEADQKYIYKKQDNAVILILKMKLPPGFDHEKQELCFGFQMKTKSHRYQTDEFTMSTPVIVNCGIASVKKDDSMSQSTAQQSTRSAAVNQSMTSTRSMAQASAASRPSAAGANSAAVSWSGSFGGG